MNLPVKAPIYAKLFLKSTANPHVTQTTISLTKFLFHCDTCINKHINKDVINVTFNRSLMTQVPVEVLTSQFRIKNVKKKCTIFIHGQEIKP
jgi:hypothetical protein